MLTSDLRHFSAWGCRCILDGAGDLGGYCFDLSRIEVSLVAFLDAVFMELEIPARGDMVTCQRALYAGEDATIDADDGTSGLGNFQQVRHIAANTGDAGHFRHTPAIQLQRNLVRRLCRAGAS